MPWEPYDVQPGDPHFDGAEAFEAYLNRATGVRDELLKCPVTGLWPGQQTPYDLPDFLRVNPSDSPQGSFPWQAPPSPAKS